MVFCNKMFPAFFENHIHLINRLLFVCLSVLLMEKVEFLHGGLLMQKQGTQGTNC